MNVNLKKRLITAGVLIALLVTGFVLAINLQSGWCCLEYLFFLAIAFAAYEFACICCRAAPACLRVAYFLIVLLPSLSVAVSALYSADHTLRDIATEVALAGGASLILADILLVVMGYFSLEKAVNLNKDIFVGILLIGIGGASLTALTVGSQNCMALIWLLLVVCMNDTAAYFCGSRIGGPKMSPFISPKKTVSGSVGGFVFGILLGLSAKDLLPQTSLLHVIILAVTVIAASQLGDLSKSYVKRIHAVKDSGSVLPGHGGFLDRIDGLLMAAPFFCLWLIYLA